MKTRTKSHRRILSAAVALILCLSLLPITAMPAFAEGEELTVYTFSELRTEAALPSSTYDIITLGGSIIGNEQLDIGRTLTLRLNDYDLTIDAAVGDGIKIAGGVRLDITHGANSELTVHGDGAGIHVPLGSELRIALSPVVEAIGNNGAGIGGGGNITIEDGNITATGGPQHAGIEGLNVNIYRGNITATGGVGGAGIGGGLFDSIGYIYINDGVITATGGDAYGGVGGGAGIGGGGGNSTSNIAIYGGNITAIGKGGGAGIGGGGGINSDCNILITGENTVVDATGDTDAQDIGRGRDGTAGNIFAAIPTANLTLASQSSNTVKFTADPSSDGTVTATLPAPFNASPPFSAGGVYNLLTELDATGKTMSVITTLPADDNVTFALTDYADVSKTGTELMASNATVAFLPAVVDTSKPTVLSVSQSGSAEGGVISVTFDEPMDTSVKGTVTLNYVPLTSEEGVWNSAFEYRAPYNGPFLGLSANVSYPVLISGFKDVAGNVMEYDSSHTFATTDLPDPPHVVSITIDEGVGSEPIPNGGTGVSRSFEIRVEFSEPINQQTYGSVSVEDVEGIRYDFYTTYFEPRAYICHPYPYLALGTTYTVIISGFTDLEGNMMEPDNSFSFTTVTHSPPSAPRHLTLTPGDGQITATWEAPTDDGASAVTGYEIWLNHDYYATVVSKTASEFSHTFTGLTNGTTYDVRVMAVNAIGDGVFERETATPAASALTGTATISNMNPRIGDTLTGSLVGGNNTGTLTYEWKVDGANAGTGATYTVQTADLGKTITLEITSSVETGTVTSAATAAVLKKAAPVAPSAPTPATKTHNSVTLTANALHEYSKDGTNWQTSNVFGGLSASTAYTFYQRIAETADTEASPSSPALNVTTNASPDTTAPTGEIVLGTHGWNSFINTITFGLFCKNTQTVTIEDIADDQSADADVTVEYYLADSAKTTEELASVTWTEYTGSFTIQPGKYVIYAKLTDEANNSATISSDGIVVFTDSAQDTAAISYTKGTNADVTADVTLSGNTIAGVKNGGTDLTLNTDYTVSGGAITFKGTYLETLAVSGYTLTVSYNPQGVTYPATPATGSDAPGTTAISLTVSDPAPTVTSVTVLPATIDVEKGGAAQQFAATVSGTNSPAQTVTWTVEGADSAGTTISNGGLLTVASGEAAVSLIVRATSTVDTNKSGTATVTVTDTPPTPVYGVSLDTGDYTFPAAQAGYGAQTAKTVKVTNTGNQATGGLTVALSGDTSAFEVTPTTINSIDVAGNDSFTVTPKTGLSAATYTATVTVSNASVTAQSFTVSFTVNPAPPTTYAVTVNNGTGGGSYAADATVTITANTAPSGQRFKNWTFSPAVTFMDGTNAASEAAKFTMPGQAVTATANYEDIPPSAIAVTGITLNQTSLSLYSNTSPNSATLTATVAPANATVKAVTWASNNTAVATVGQNGKVTAVGNGTAIITVITTDGSYMASCTVTISTYSDGSGGTPNVYDVIDHFNVWNGSGTVSARIDADHTEFVQLTYNGAEIHPSNYTITQGSTIVTLKESHLSTYPNGTHTLVAHFIGGYSADIPLTVNKQAAGNTNNSNPGTGVPQTGDSSNMAALWIALICATLGILCLTVWRKRQRMASNK